MTARPFDAVSPSADDSNRRSELCGRTLGDYRIERRVGGGATSDVFLATQISLGRPVALKILKDELANDETYLKRFLQEARAAARLEHPNIVRIYEVGALVDDGAAAASTRRSAFGRWRRRAGEKTYRFIAQEFIEGTSLQQFLRRNGPTSILQTFSALEQIASALKRAADAGVVHRDVKPENVLLDATGTIKVVDFGLAWIAGALDSVAATALTRTGFALGTPLYMSPEQARGQKIDFRSDVYSLGVVAYRMLTGTTPFRGETPLAVVLKHLNEKPRPIVERRPDVPPALAKLVERTIEKNPNDRPASMDELLADLRAARREYETILAAASNESAASTASALDVGGAVGSTGFALNLPPSESTDSNDGENSPKAERSGGFFQSEKEREDFERIYSTSNLSRQWQANWTKLTETRNVGERIWTRRRVVLCALTALGAFLLGGGALLAKNRWVASTSTEPPLTIRRFDSVEEQWVFALQLGTVDAWKSVEEYFPNDKYWKIRAQKQLALVYMNENNVPEASAIFEKLAARPATGRDFDPFGLAGLAWRDANENRFDRAVATISELRAAQTPQYDGLTEAVIEKTQETIRQKIGVDVANRGVPSGDRNGGRNDGPSGVQNGGRNGGPSGVRNGGGRNGGRNGGPNGGGPNGGSGRKFDERRDDA